MHSLKSEVKVMDSYNVQLHWDDEAKVWWADSEDIPGLILESDTADELIKRMVNAAPEMIELNNVDRRKKMHFIFSSRDEDVTFD